MGHSRRLEYSPDGEKGQVPPKALRVANRLFPWEVATHFHEIQTEKQKAIQPAKFQGHHVTEGTGHTTENPWQAASKIARLYSSVAPNATTGTPL
jgi:hypothetical protein